VRDSDLADIEVRRETGRAAEELVIAWLRGRADIVKVDDLRDQPGMQAADVDVRIRHASGRDYFADIKSDRNLGESPNVLFEVLRINHEASPRNAVTLGWAARSASEFFFYYAPAKNQIWAFPAAALRKAFQEYTAKARRSIRFDVVITDPHRTTVNVLLPLSFCEGKYTTYDLAGGQL
jgi:hypothetical protein